MTQWEWREHHWISRDDWPFEHNDDGIATANSLVPSDFEFMYSANEEPGYHLVEYRGRAAEDGGSA